MLTVSLSCHDSLVIQLVNMLTRRYTQQDRDVYASLRLRSVAADNWVEYIVPENWGPASTDILIERVFCKEALPALTRRMPQDGIPEWLWPQRPDDTGLDNISAEYRYRFEKDIRDVLNRVAGATCFSLLRAGIFLSEEEARIFYDEYRHILLHRIALPEIEILSKVGLDWAYGMAPSFFPAHSISGFDEDRASGGRVVSLSTEQRNIFKKAELIAAEHKLQEKSLPAAIVVPVENIDSAAFINWRRQQDIDSVAHGLGRRLLAQGLHHVLEACDRDSLFGFDPVRNKKLAAAVDEAQAAGLDDVAISMAIDYARQGYDEIDTGDASPEDRLDFSVQPVLSVPDHFIESALTDHGFMLYAGGSPVRRASAQKIWDKTAEAIWATGAPQLLFRDCAFSGALITEEGDIGRSASGGFVFAKGASAPSAALDVIKFISPDFSLDTAALDHAVRILTLGLSGARFGFDHRCPVAISMTNVAAFLMSQGLSYDSDEGRSMAAFLSAFMTGSACNISAEMAQRTGGGFDRTDEARQSVLSYFRRMQTLLSGGQFVEKGALRRPPSLSVSSCPDQNLVTGARAVFDQAFARARHTGLYHAHLTMMDIDLSLQTLLGAQTHGLAPENALVRFEGWFDHRAEGQMYGKKLNPCIPLALKKKGYGPAQIDDIHFYAVGHGTLLDAPSINHATLRQRGFHQAALDAIESALSTAQHIRYVFNKWTLGEDFCLHMLGLSADETDSPTFDMLLALGFSEDEIEAANIYCCGTMMLEGAPHLKPHDLDTFDCAFPPSAAAVRSVAATAQVSMQSAVQPFLTGGIAQTVFLDHAATIDDVQKLLLKGWEWGLKNLSIYRQGCSLRAALAPAASAPLRLEKEETIQQKITVRA